MKEKKTIAIFGVKTVPYTGGIEYVVENTAPYFNKDKYEVIIYVREKYFKSNECIPNVKIICLPHLKGKNTEAITHTFLSILHAIFIEKADIFFFHAIVLGSLTFLPKLFFKKVILQTHGLDWKREKWGKIAKLFIKFSTLACTIFPDITICVGRSDVNFFKENYKKKFELVRNGVRTAEIYETNDDMLRHFSLERKKYIMFMARLVPEKGPHILIKAFKDYLRENTDINLKLVIAGDTNYHDKYYYELIKEANDKVVFTGFVKGEDKYQLLANAILLVQPSSIEGMSITLLEAMGYGITPIVSDIKENLDILANFGLKFKVGDTNDLKEKIAYFIKEKENFDDKKDFMINYVRENFSWDDIISRLTNIFENI